ncbi:hypothetical protein [Curtobacterium pusillum]|nr:hypothetical protein [Curtobacterium pusillum]
MEHLSVDTVPLTTVTGPAGPGPSFVVHIDEHAGTVTLDPHDA